MRRNIAADSRLRQPQAATPPGFFTFTNRVIVSRRQPYAIPEKVSYYETTGLAGLEIADRPIRGFLVSFGRYSPAFE